MYTRGFSIASFFEQTLIYLSSLGGGGGELHSYYINNYSTREQTLILVDGGVGASCMYTCLIILYNYEVRN